VKKRILVTGGAGFIGCKLVRRLLSKDFEVTVLDNLSPQIHGETTPQKVFGNLLKDINFVQDDIRNQSKLKDVLKKNDIIFHLASETGTGQSMYSIKQYVDVNINGTANLLECLALGKNNAERVILSSSRAVYGEGAYSCEKHGIVYPLKRYDLDLQNGCFFTRCPICGSICSPVPTSENASLNPVSIYGITKQVQEQLVKLACFNNGIPYTILRYQNVYGPGQSLKNPYTGILSIFSTLIKTNHKINIFEDGQESRDFIYIDDVISGTLAPLNNSNSNNEIFNLGTGLGRTVLDVAKILRKIYNSNVPLEISGDYRIGDIRHNIADISKAKTYLDFKPSVAFETGISYFTDWVNSQKLLPTKYEASLDEMEDLNLLKKTIIHD